MGQLVGYVRVSSVGQNTARQLDGVELDKCFSDHCSGSTTDRSGLSAALAYVRDGDRLIVHSMDRLGRDLKDLLILVEHLNAKGVGVEFKKECLTFTADDTSPMSKLMLQIMGAVAEFERSLINERRSEGQAKAKADGKHIGRKGIITPSLISKAVELRQDGLSVPKVAEKLKVSQRTVYNLFSAAKEKA